MSIRRQLEQDIKARNNKEAGELLLDFLKKYNALVDELEAEKADLSAVDFTAFKIKID